MHLHNLCIKILVVNGNNVLIIRGVTTLSIDKEDVITKKKISLTSLSRTVSPVVPVSAGRGGSVLSGGSSVVKSEGKEKVFAVEKIDPTRPKAETFEGAGASDLVGKNVDRAQSIPFEDENVLVDCPTFARKKVSMVEELYVDQVEKKGDMPQRKDSGLAEHNGRMRSAGIHEDNSGTLITSPIDAELGSAHASTLNPDQYKKEVEVSSNLTEPFDDTEEVALEVCEAETLSTETKQWDICMCSCVFVYTCFTKLMGILFWGGLIVLVSFLPVIVYTVIRWCNLSFQNGIYGLFQ